MYVCVSCRGIWGGEWRASWQPLAPACPVGIRLGANSLHCDSWDLGANQDTTPGTNACTQQEDTQDRMGGKRWDIVSEKKSLSRGGSGSSFVQDLNQAWMWLLKG